MHNVHGDRTDYWGLGAQDGHLDFDAAPELRRKRPRFAVLRDSETR